MSELNTPEPTSPASRWPRLLLMSVAVMGLLVAAWVGGTHWLLNGTWLQERISRIDGIEIQWRSGTSLHPGRWEVEGLRIARTDATLPLELEAERATLSLSLLALLRGELVIKALDADAIRRVSVGDIALTAQGSLTLRDTLLSREAIAIGALDIDVAAGELTRQSDGASLVQAITLDGEASLDRLNPVDADSGALNPDLLAALDATLTLHARADAWDVFMPYLSALPWLSLRGSGELTGSLTLTEGMLTPGSQLRLDAPGLTATLDETRLRRQGEREWRTPDAEGMEERPARHLAHGEGSVVLTVNDRALALALQLDNVTLADTHPYARNTALALEARSRNQRLDRIEPPQDATLDLVGEFTRLDVFDRYLRTTLDGQGILLNGAGRVALSLGVEAARPARGELDISADRLSVEALQMHIGGSGELHAHLEEHDRLAAELRLRDAHFAHRGRALMSGADISVNAQSPWAPEQARQEAEGILTWENARLDDVARLQPYLAAFMPSPAPLIMAEGSAASSGQISVNATHLSGQATLRGDAVTTRWRRASESGDSDETRIVSDIALDLTLPSARLDGTQLDLSGTRLRWAASSDSADGETLESLLLLPSAHLQRAGSDAPPSGDVTLEGSVRQLGFLDAFLPDAHGLSLSGNGLLRARLVFRDRTPLPPTHLRIDAEALDVGFLDYLASGRGELSVAIEEADSAELSLGLPYFTLTREGDDRPHLQGRHLTLTTRTEQLREALDAPDPELFVTHVTLPITEVPDLTRYNAYLPDGAGLRLEGGQASLASELWLDGMRARGSVTLRAFGADLALLDQRLHGDVHLQLNLSDGDLVTRRFTADDSFLHLENVARPQTSTQPGPDTGWWVRLDMPRAELLWADSPELDASLALGMRDTGLLARLFLAKARERDWLGRLLSVHDIAGSARLILGEAHIALEDLELDGGPLQLRAALRLANEQANGALYARLGALGLGVELVNGEPTLHVIQPRRWFERWQRLQRLR